MKLRVRAPSNIALIKYMGKTDSTRNLPENPSLSMTLDRLCTYLEVEILEDGADRFQLDPKLPELPSGVRTCPVNFDPKAVAKFETHESPPGQGHLCAPCTMLRITIRSPIRRYMAI